MTVEELNGKPFKGLIDVTRLLRAPVGSSRSYRISEIVSGPAKNSIKGKVKLTHGGQEVLVQSELTVEVELTCSRCLDAFLYPVSFHIEEEFLPVTDIPSNSPLSYGSGDFIINSNNMFDLGEVIRQYTLLNLPMKPLCQTDCAGIKEVSSYGSA